MLFRNTLILRRQFSGTTTLLQQYTARTPTSFRPFGQSQPAEAVEETGGEEYNAGAPSSPAPARYSQFSSRPSSTARAFTPPQTSEESKSAINPFPEELTQDYSSLNLFSGASDGSFPKDVVDILHAELASDDIEIKPDGAVYLPENRYRRILCKAFGPGGWCLIPRGAHSISNGVLSREYALFCGGKFVSQVRGHATIQGFSNPAMASEVVRSNALMRGCKDLGIGNELWDPAFIANWRATYAVRRTENGKFRWGKKEQ